jgi:hypothetical protein
MEGHAQKAKDLLDQAARETQGGGSGKSQQRIVRIGPPTTEAPPRVEVVFCSQDTL